VLPLASPSLLPRCSLPLHPSTLVPSLPPSVQLMTTFFGGYCLRDVLISTLLALGLGGSIQSFYAPPPKPIPARRGPFSSPAPPPPSPPASSSSFPPLRDPDEGELDGLKLAATLLSGGVCATYLWGPAAAVAAAGASGGGEYGVGGRP